MRILLGLALVTVLAVPAAQAAADSTPAPVDVVFTDPDPVLGERPSATEGIIHVRRNVGRGTLIRIRASFVQELLKDAEDV